MKNITPKYWVLICFVLINLGVSAQINNIYKIPSDSQVVTLVEEVYSENSEKEIFNRKARYNFIKNLLQKRIVVTSDKDILNKIEDIGIKIIFGIIRDINITKHFDMNIISSE